MLAIKTVNSLKQVQCDLLCLYAHETGSKPENQNLLDAALKKRVAAAIETYEFTGKLKETLVIEGNARIKRILLLGLGKKGDFNRDLL